MNAPTLLVGLGGTGSDIVQKVYERASEEQRKNIEFVIFDTDINELRTIEEKTPQIKTVQTSTRLTVGEYLECDHFSRDNWFPVNKILNGKALTEGAGQVRAVSRLAINTAIQQGKMESLNKAIEDLYKLKGQKTIQAPRVMLVGSLCGGTGSGLILPVAMYIRNFMTTKLQQSSAIVRGFFLLPEVFDGVIKTQSERNNLRCNAYAAIREIDAFMMKDDGSLPARYQLEFKVPRVGSNEQDSYSGKPMDFCFLFDAQNINGMKLNSFAEYKEHAANCIYGMTIAPTSKRSNSSEDNVIREIVYAGGRNRFAGAGTSMLIYPTVDIKKYLALKWTKESISDEWLQIDKQYYVENDAAIERRKQGYQEREIDRGEHYISVINQGFADEKAFVSAIRNLCYCYDEHGYIEESTHWEDYIDELNFHIQKSIEENQLELEDIQQKINGFASAGNEKGADLELFAGWYKKLLEYRAATIKISGNLAKRLAYSLFKENNDYTKTDKKFRFEYWLHRDGAVETFIHPNAVRYFLYNAIRILKVKERESKKRIEEIKTFWEDFEKVTFDLPETPDIIEDLGQFANGMHLNDESRIQRIIHRSKISEAQDHLNRQFGKFMSETQDYWNALISERIYHDAIECFTNLCNAFHDFYDVLNGNLEKLDREIRELEAKYVTKPGEALRYVCADKKCLRGLAKDVKNLSSSLDIPPELSAAIFTKMKDFALAEQKPEKEKYFTETFNETVVEYLADLIMSRYTSIVDMDIITALEREAHYENPEENYDLDDARLYAQNVIESTEILAKPFIESPVGKEPRVIPACAYHPSLATADFPGRNAFVSKYLLDGGGVADESIEKNMILFYQAVYDLRANELSKFAPPYKAETYDRTGGEYYNAYYELVQKLHPDTTKSKAITPHIDRWWHIISKMPDLDEDSQRQQEERINKAFFWAMLGQYVQLNVEDKYKAVYQLDRTSLGVQIKDENKHIEQLIVSNGTPCDHLYEVLDAFTIYPHLVETINSHIEEQISSALYRKTPLKETFLFKWLEMFEVDEFKCKAEIGARSVFELPLLMKQSVPVEEYFEEDMMRLLETIITNLELYVCRFCNKKEAVEELAELIMSQFERLIENAKEENSFNIFEDSLFAHICKVITIKLEDMNMQKDSLKVQEIYRTVRTQ